ncbi:MAG: hypothetical protein HY749_12390 [Gammaproteobacteria bacterium]|nr:hypothetical protein [Gammaproteobacteria bacterium]MBI5616129.1 hypothetical protein [Gammaproteobacteria bacterium]
MIEIEMKSDTEPMVFNVTISDSAGSTRHRVTLKRETYERLTRNHAETTPQRCIEAAFTFLLERESKTDILKSFDINVINMYFPSFERELAHYL